MGGQVLALFLAAALFLPGGRSRGGWGVSEVLPGAARGGAALARVFFRLLEERAVPLKPGRIFLVRDLSSLSRDSREGVLSGMAEVFRSRGFVLVRGEKGKEPSLLLWAAKEGGGPFRLFLSAPALGVRPASVRVVPVSWLAGPEPPAGTFRAAGPWEDSPQRALASAREQAEGILRSRLARVLPWRPWKEDFLGKISTAGLERDTFLQERSTREGKLWKGWVLWEAGRDALDRAAAGLAREDRRWLLRVGLAFSAGLLLWFGAARLDWATRGFFTGRIRILSFLTWMGTCGALWLVV